SDGDCKVCLERRKCSKADTDPDTIGVCIKFDCGPYQHCKDDNDCNTCHKKRVCLPGSWPFFHKTFYCSKRICSSGKRCTKNEHCQECRYKSKCSAATESAETSGECT